MRNSERGWVRGAVVIGIAGTMMAVAMLSPALGVSFATKKFVKQKVNAAKNQLQGQITQVNAAISATQAQAFVRTAPVAVPAGAAVAAEIGCPTGMVATGGGVSVSNSALVMNDSVPTDGTGAFPASFGLAGGVGFTAWGGIVTSTGGPGTMRVYASCRTGAQTGSNYTAGGAAVRSADAGSTFTNVSG